MEDNSNNDKEITAYENKENINTELYENTDLTVEDIENLELINLAKKSARGMYALQGLLFSDIPADFKMIQKNKQIMEMISDRLFSEERVEKMSTKTLMSVYNTISNINFKMLNHLTHLQSSTIQVPETLGLLDKLKNKEEKLIPRDKIKDEELDSIKEQIIEELSKRVKIDEE